MNFTQKLQKAAAANNSLLCVGLDPDTSLLPEGIRLEDFIRSIIDATRDLVCAYKVNFAFFEALGKSSFYYLEYARQCIPADIPAIADAKRADIGNTSKAYASAVFEQLGFDGITVNPYMGRDSLAPFIEYTDRGIFVLCRTSNPGSADFQNLEVTTREGCIPLYRAVAGKAAEWNRHGNIGLVMGATHPDELGVIRRQCPDMLLLIPGIGTQGGDIRMAVENGTNRQGEMALINSSRQIIHASLKADFAEKSREAALSLKEQINCFRGRG
ncbi:MAG: orotidine-5'-phosphate decarboxylase [Dehalococcoidaceae bacterium]|nr:orotidine-5'-phosphate decarboxylase [Dehalococcoidaceae bacterium]